MTVIKNEATGITAQTPLPFWGNKKYWRKQLVELAKRFPKNATVVDVFGGSGYCSYAIKRTRPDLRVVCNDFDNYKERLDNVETTEEIRAYLKPKLYFKEQHTYTLMQPQEKELVLSYLKEWKESGKYYDEQTITSWFYWGTPVSYDLFTCEKLCNKIAQESLPIERCKHWYDGIERVQFDATQTDLLNEYPDAYFILDPPYINTNNKRYEGKDAYAVIGSVVKIILSGRGFALFDNYCYLPWVLGMVDSNTLEIISKKTPKVCMTKVSREEIMITNIKSVENFNT